jgi:ABC-2 type transport system permease protein
MGTIFRYAFVRNRGQILGWGLALGLLALYLMPFYDTLAKEQETLKQLLASYPPELLAFFGDTSSGLTALFTPEGYLGFEFFSYLPLILGVFAVLAGSGLLASDEENGTLDLVLAHPVPRARLFIGRVLAWLATLAGILGLTWLGLIVGLRWSHIDLTPLELARPFLSLGAELLLFGGLALLLSLLLPARRLAAMVAGLMLVASFFVTSLARVDDNLKDLARFSPLNYYQGGQAIVDLNWAWLAGLAGLALLFIAASAWLFQRRDIRVAGEGSWRLPLLGRLRRKASGQVSA